MKLLLRSMFSFSGIIVLLVLEGFLPPVTPGKAQLTGSKSSPVFQEPRMEIEDLTTRPMTVLFIRDTAATQNEIGPTLAKNYSEIGMAIQANKLKYAGMPLAWYYNQSEPVILEAGIPVEKAPANLSGRVQVKQVPESKAVVVHFWGPYELTEKAYPLIQEWLKQKNKTPLGAPYDVYVTDPTTVKDPYQVRTDIHQPYK